MWCTLKKVLGAFVFIGGVSINGIASATIVEFQTVMGNFKVNLYDKTTPKTVENFLAYVNSGAYTDSIIHRLDPGFIIQGGGFVYDTSFPMKAIKQNSAVVNEPVYANKRGTIAMAKLGGNPDSATNQWFFNLADNSKSLDSYDNNGGYTVFGEVMGDGMGVIDNMASLKIYSVNKALGSPPLPDKLFSETPLLKYTATDASNNVPITVNNLVMVLAVVVWDSNVDTAANLTPAKSTYKKPSGGGAFDLTALLYLVLILSLALWRSARNQKPLKNNFVTAL